MSMLVSYITQTVQSTDPSTWVAIIIAGFSLAVSMIVAIPVTLTAWNAYRKPGHLCAHLTRDLFVRYTEVGETLFLNVLLVAETKDIIVSKVQGELSTPHNTKTLPLKLLKIGSPMWKGQPNHDHYFFSSSAIDLIPIDTPIRRIYWVVIEEYESALEEAFLSLRSALLDLGNSEQMRHSIATAEALPKEAKDALAATQKEFVDKYIDSVQLEETEYKLTLKFAYRNARGGSSKNVSETCATITFKIPLNVKQYLRAQLERMSTGLAEHIILGKGEYSYPEILPSSITTHEG